MTTSTCLMRIIESPAERTERVRMDPTAWNSEGALGTESGCGCMIEKDYRGVHCCETLRCAVLPSNRTLRRQVVTKHSRQQRWLSLLILRWPPHPLVQVPESNANVQPARSSSQHDRHRSQTQISKSHNPSRSPSPELTTRLPYTNTRHVTIRHLR